MPITTKDKRAVILRESVLQIRLIVHGKIFVLAVAYLQFHVLLFVTN